MQLLTVWAEVVGGTVTLLNAPAHALMFEGLVGPGWDWGGFAPAEGAVAGGDLDENAD